MNGKVMDYQPSTIRVVLKRTLNTIKVRFPVGSVQTIEQSPSGSYWHVQGYPSVVVTDKDWAPYWDEDAMLEILHG